MDYRINPIGRQTTAPPPPPRGYVDDTTGNNSSRRRVAVACARCRKRKIRCSGDPGDGSGCANCRSAGADSRECRFTRVGSAEVDIHDIGYHLERYSSTPNLPLPAYQQPFTQHPRSYSTNSCGLSASRLSYGDPTPSMTYNEAGLETFGVSGSTIAPSQEGLAALYGLQDTVRHNPGVTEGAYGASTKAYAHGSDHIHYSGAPQLPVISTAMSKPSLIPAENFSPYSLASLSLNHSGRQLPLPPPPSGMRIQLAPAGADEVSHSRLSSHANYPTAETDPRYTKHSMAWDEPHGLARSSYHGMSTSAPMYNSDRTLVSGQHNTVLRYIPVNYSPDLSPTTAPSLSFSTATSTSTPISAHHTGLTLPCTPTDPCDGTVERSGSASNLYALASCADSSRRDSTDFPGSQEQCHSTLVNGQHYHPVAHPRPIHMASFEALSRSSVPAANLSGPSADRDDANIASKL